MTREDVIRLYDFHRAIQRDLQNALVKAFPDGTIVEIDLPTGPTRAVVDRLGPPPTDTIPVRVMGIRRENFPPSMVRRIE
jgi:hypothetical protein